MENPSTWLATRKKAPHSACAGRENVAAASWEREKSEGVEPSGAGSGRVRGRNSLPTRSSPAPALPSRRGGAAGGHCRDTVAKCSRPAQRQCWRRGRQSPAAQSAPTPRSRSWACRRSSAPRAPPSSDTVASPPAPAPAGHWRGGPPAAAAPGAPRGRSGGAPPRLARPAPPGSPLQPCAPAGAGSPLAGSPARRGKRPRGTAPPAACAQGPRAPPPLPPATGPGSPAARGAQAGAPGRPRSWRQRQRQKQQEQEQGKGRGKGQTWRAAAKKGGYRALPPPPSGVFTRAII
jgi:hypothetical protein